MRLLDNASICFAMSNHALLIYRKGRPAVSVRALSSTGHLTPIDTNRRVNMFFACQAQRRDKTTGEGYGSMVSIEFPYMNMVQAFALASVYSVTDDNGPLVVNEIVFKNAKGEWKWNQVRFR